MVFELRTKSPRCHAILWADFPVFLKKIPLTVRCYRATENNVLLRPGMHGTAMRARELLCLHCGRFPPFFFDCLSRIGEF